MAFWLPNKAEPFVGIIFAVDGPLGGVRGARLEVGQLGSCLVRYDVVGTLSGASWLDLRDYSAQWVRVAAALFGVIDDFAGVGLELCLADLVQFEISTELLDLLFALFLLAKSTFFL